MDPDRWRHISALLDEALGFSSEQERNHWIEGLRERQPDVAGDVQTLLARYQIVQDERFLEGSPLQPRPIGLAPGATLGPYSILKWIGAGGMGEVYSARDTRLGRTVAIKVLGNELDLTGDRRRRFLREARAVSALTHPNIVTLYDIGKHEGTDFLVMEYVDGPTLATRLRGGPLPIPQAVTFGRQIAEAMAKAHASGILHRDLKPSNVIVADDRTVKVLDFGLAKTADEQAGAAGNDGDTAMASPALTRGGAISGTPAYMSPEQAEGRAVDERSDIFSFGALLYEMVTGRRAFQSSSATTAMSSVVHENPAPARAVAAQVPPALDALIARCLRRDPADRPQSMTDVAAILNDLDPSHTPPVTSPGRTLLIASAIAGVVAIAIAGWFVLAPEPEERGLTRLSPAALTSHPGNESAPTLSPDGRQVAYIADHGGNPDLYVQPTQPGATPVRLTSTPEAESWPAWSPDGRWIAFLRTRPGQRQQTVLRSVADGRETILKDEQCAMLTWSGDSRSIVCGANSGTRPNGLRRIQIQGGAVDILTTPPADLFDMFPAVSPDGRRVAFVRASRASPARELYEQHLTRDGGVDGEPQLQYRFPSLVGSLAYAGSNRLLVATQPDTQTQTGGMRLAHLTIGGRTAHPIFLDLPEGSHFRPGVANGHLVYVQDGNRHEIWRTRDGVEERHPVTSTRDDAGARFSPDGMRLAFISARSGRPEIWLAQADGSQAVQLTSLGGVDWVNWAPDATWLVFSRREEAASVAIYTVAAAGGAPRRLTSGTSTDLRPSVSRDGRHIYFSSNRAGSRQVFRMTIDGRDVVAVTSDGGDFPEETFDGQSVLFVRPAGGTAGVGPLWLIPVGGGPVRQLPVTSLGNGGFVVGREGVYVRSSLDSGAILVHDPATGLTRSVATLTGSNELSSISPDGRTLLWNHHVFTGRDLMLVTSFR